MFAKQGIFKDYLKLHKFLEARKRGLERVSPPQDRGSGKKFPGKILKFATQFGVIWCILATN